ncbi:MAG: hypothetical protein MJZ22_04505 [Candidatus Saccharibacteria bacterium]|nr:hypothetical protein [Candidatus Saccharibacteria bacterium]
MELEYWNKFINRAKNLFGDNQPHILPYIGDNYNQVPIKVLSLGESHYGKNAAIDCSNTIDVFLNSYQCHNEKKVASFSERAKDIGVARFCNCYRKVASMISGEIPKKADYIWDNLCFYNYFTKFVGKTFDEFKLPQDKNCTEEKNDLFEIILPQINPDIVIVWGKRLRNHLPKPDGIIENNILLDLGCFKYQKYPNTVFYPITHPSAFRNNGWDSYKECCRWKELKSVYPKLETLARRHPAHKIVQDIHNTIKKRRMGFGQSYSEKSCDFYLNPIEHGKQNPNSPRLPHLEIIFDEKLNAKIRFYTQRYDVTIAKEILAHPIWNVDVNEINKDENGKVTLREISSNENYMEVLEKYLNRMLLFRKENT